MISSDVIRGYNDTLILYMLLEGESYGYEISKNIRQLTDEKYVMKETTLYSAFTRLEKNGYIESFYQDESSLGKRRTYYRITPDGLDYYRKSARNGRLRKRSLICLSGSCDGIWRQLWCIWTICLRGCRGVLKWSG